MTPYLQDGLNAHIIFCPKCQSNNQHITHQLYYRTGENYSHEVPFVVHVCTMCGMISFDNYKKIETSGIYDFYRLYPYQLPANLPQPNDDLPEPIRDIFIEAAHIFAHSPRAAAALLRLALQQLLEHCGYNSKCKGKADINNMIAAAVADGVPTHIQQFMDITRVQGNAAAHGNDLTLNPDERRDNAEYLFTVVNTIAEHLLTYPRQAQENYNKLPEAIRAQIAQRDKHP